MGVRRNIKILSRLRVETVSMYPSLRYTLVSRNNCCFCGGVNLMWEWCWFNLSQTSSRLTV